MTAPANFAGEKRMEARHTPGPWITTEDTSRDVAITTQARVDLSMGSICEMDVYYDGAHGVEQPANLNLILAAPDLVKALQQIARLSKEGEVSANMQYALGDIASAALVKVGAV